MFHKSGGVRYKSYRIKAHYTREMVGKYNGTCKLKTSQISRGIMEGMLLCAEDADGNLALVTPENHQQEQKYANI